MCVFTYVRVGTWRCMCMDVHAHGCVVCTRTYVHANRRVDTWLCTHRVPIGLCRCAHTAVYMHIGQGRGLREPLLAPKQGSWKLSPCPRLASRVWVVFPWWRAGRGQLEAPGTRAGTLVPRATWSCGKQLASRLAPPQALPSLAVGLQHPPPPACTHLHTRLCFTSCSWVKQIFANSSSDFVFQMLV